MGRSMGLRYLERNTNSQVVSRAGTIAGAALSSFSCVHLCTAFGPFVVVLARTLCQKWYPTQSYGLRNVVQCVHRCLDTHSGKGTCVREQ
jgi:hypothetical protein